MTLTVKVPIRIVSEANERDHWRTKARRVATHRDTTHWAMRAHPRPQFPLVVTITRIAPRDLDDDNLTGGCKAARDGVADWLGIDDRDPRVTWKYAQERGDPKEYAAMVKVEAAQ